MPTIYVDDRAYQFEGLDRNVLDVCLHLGLDIPYYCWHPSMQSAGACRQCAVKLYRDQQDAVGEIVMSCMTPATDGVRISIDDPDAVEFRAAVAEWLMLNHPHDCPVCDEGGECHLQDMTHITGHVHRRSRFPKRTFENRDHGPHLNHEMNRCIHCYRCVRFCQEVAGERDLDAFGWHDDVYIGRHGDGALRGGLAGNLVEVCPTGCFTDKTFKRHYVRPWDLQTAPSICVHCGLGCNTLPGERDGMLRRIRSRHNAEVNRHFICDRGRFGYGSVNSERRVRRPLVRGDDGNLHEVGRQAALDRVAVLFERGRVLGIGSPRATLETNFALRALVGSEGFFDGASDRQRALMSLALRSLIRGPGRSASQRDVARADAVLILGEDVGATAPMLAVPLRHAILQQALSLARKLNIHEFQDSLVREAIQQDTGPLFIATVGETLLDPNASATYRHAPDDIARLGAAVARCIDPTAPSVEDLDERTVELAAWIADDLQAAERPLVICGISLGSPEVIKAASNVVSALAASGKQVGYVCCTPECNSLGLALMGGRPLGDLVRAARQDDVAAIVIVENDIRRRMPASEFEAFIPEDLPVVVVDHLMTATARRADTVLPAATFAESTGTLVNAEGRAQRSFQVFPPHDDVAAAWRWLAAILARRDRLASPPWRSVDGVQAALAAELPVLAGAREAAPPAGSLLHGMRMPRQSVRHSGRTASTADHQVHEAPPPEDADSPLAFSPEGYRGPAPTPIRARQWAPGWNSAQAANKVTGRRGAEGPPRAAGERLIEPGDAAVPYHVPPRRFVAHHELWLVVPVYCVFGSDELGAYSDPLAELASDAYVGISPSGLEKLRVPEGHEVGLAVGNDVYTLPVRIRLELPEGVLAVPVGAPDLEGVQLPTWAKVVGSGMTPWTI